MVMSCAARGVKKVGQHWAKRYGTMSDTTISVFLASDNAKSSHSQWEMTCVWLGSLCRKGLRGLDLFHENIPQNDAAIDKSINIQIL